MTIQSKKVSSVVELLNKWWGDQLNWAAIAKTIQAVRGKRLYTEILPLPASIQGFCVALRDCDVIGLRKSLDQERLEFTQLHEASHLLLGHIPYFSFDDETPTYSEYQMARGKWLCNVRYRNFSIDELEKTAETLAYALLEKTRAGVGHVSVSTEHFYIMRHRGRP